jgi:hypothetical protein
MNVDLNDQEAATLLRELDHIIDGDLFPIAAHQAAETDLREDPAAAGARAATAAAALGAAAGRCETATLALRSEPRPPASEANLKQNRQ